jgi:hypothetical protein
MLAAEKLLDNSLPLPRLLTILYKKAQVRGVRVSRMLNEYAIFLVLSSPSQCINSPHSYRVNIPFLLTYLYCHEVTFLSSDSVHALGEKAHSGKTPASHSYGKMRGRRAQQGSHQYVIQGPAYTYKGQLCLPGTSCSNLHRVCIDEYIFKNLI